MAEPTKKVDAAGRKVDPGGKPLRRDGVDDALPANAVSESGVEFLHTQMKQEQADGFRGRAADPTPNENYTVAGVLDPDKHVPEEFKHQTGVTHWPADVVADKS